MRVALHSGQGSPKPGVGGVTQHSGRGAGVRTGWGCPAWEGQDAADPRRQPPGGVVSVSGGQQGGRQEWGPWGPPTAEGELCAQWGAVSQDRQRQPGKTGSPQALQKWRREQEGVGGALAVQSWGSAGLPDTPGLTARSSQEPRGPRGPPARRPPTPTSPPAPPPGHSCTTWAWGSRSPARVSEVGPHTACGGGRPGGHSPTQGLPPGPAGLVAWADPQPSPLCGSRPLQRSGLPRVTPAGSPRAACRGRRRPLRPDRPRGHRGGPQGGDAARTGARGAAGRAGAQEEGGPPLSGPRAHGSSCVAGRW